MGIVFSLLAVILFVALLFMGIQSVISITWAFGWLLVAIVIVLIVLEVIDRTIGIWTLVAIIILVIIISFFV